MIPLVLLHGWALNHKIFDNFRDGLQRECVTPDLPGHGRAPNAPVWQSTDMTAHVLQGLPQAFDLLGWSLGAQIALQLASAAPDRINRLILLSATPKFIRSEDWPHGLALDSLKILSQQFEFNPSRTVNDFLGLQVRGDSAAAETLPRLRQALREGGEGEPEALRAALHWLEAIDQRPLLSSVHQQTLVIAGQYDRIVRPEASKSLAAQLPNALYLEIPRCGHAPFISHVDEIRALVQEFLQ
jgi:pimeloyl-[acyl-carrier protein] methyl ester esterase